MAERELINDASGSRIGFKPKVAAELESLVRDIWSVKPHPDNPRRGNIEAIAESLRRYGQQKPIVVQKSSMIIVAGRHTWEAAHLLGWGQIAMSVEDLDDEEALGYLLADNRASDMASYEKKQLLAGLKRLAAGPGLTMTLYGAEELDELEIQIEGISTTDLAEFRGGYADPESAEARKTASTQAGEKMREVPLVLSLADHALFMEAIRTLQRKYGTGGVIATIIEAVKREAERVQAEV